MIRDRPKSRRTRNTTFLTNHGVPLRYLATGHYWLYLNLTYRTVLGVPPVPVGLASARLRRPIGAHAFRHVRAARPPGTRYALAGSRMVPPPGTAGTAWYYALAGSRTLAVLREGLRTPPATVLGGVVRQGGGPGALQLYCTIPPRDRSPLNGVDEVEAAELARMVVVVVRMLVQVVVVFAAARRPPCCAVENAPPVGSSVESSWMYSYSS